MDKLHSHCPLANTGGDTLDGTVPHISSSEDAGDTGLQEEKFAVKRPTLWRMSFVICDTSYSFNWKHTLQWQ